MNLAKKVQTNVAHEVKPIDVIRFMLHDALFKKSPTNWTVEQSEVERERVKMRQVGVIHATTSKNAMDLGKSIVFSSFESLEAQLDRLSHFTPQIYMWGKANNKGRSHDNTRFYTTFMVDFDCDITVAEIIYKAAAMDLPEPNVILSTPRGMQLFYVLDSKFAGSKKARKAARFIAAEVRRAFGQKNDNDDKVADQGANPLGYARIPKADNLEYVQFQPVSSEWLFTWARKQSRLYKKPVVSRRGIFLKKDGILDDPAIRKLLETTYVKGQKGNILGRNNSIFTLGLALKYAGQSQDEIYDTIDQWNTNLKWSLSNQEVKQILTAVMKDEYVAPSKAAIRELTGMELEFTYRIITPKKPREERERIHLWEWENDVIQYIEENCSPEAPYVVGTIRGLAERFGMSKQSFQAVLKRSKRLLKKTYGKGCKAFTLLTTRTVVKKANTYISKQFLRSTTDHDSEKCSENTKGISVFQADTEPIIYDSTNPLKPG